jgi:hypothetical protein
MTDVRDVASEAEVVARYRWEANRFAVEAAEAMRAGDYERGVQLALSARDIDRLANQAAG